MSRKTTVKVKEQMRREEEKEKRREAYLHPNEF